MQGVADIAVALSDLASLEELEALRSFDPTGVPNDAQALTLGYRIAAVTGVKALEKAVAALDEQRKPKPPAEPGP